MKLVHLLSVVLATLFATSVVLAERDDPLQVFPQLKRSKKVLSGFVDILGSIQSEVVLAEESYIKNSIKDESEILKLLTADDVQVSGPQCIEFVKTSTNLLMNLAGIGYTNCFNEADDELYNEISKATSISREKYDQFNLIGAFRGENIFVDSGRIRDKISTRQRSGNVVPNLSQEKLEEIRNVARNIKENFLRCMSTAQEKLAANLEHTSRQIRAICGAESSKQILN
ncbi:uncharacterized protein LOC129744596 [Uranotaenia lowii]|uniref:uncharacterized protein LOC129744596 n=1 Tax=Uranotaenia lowii TaxID=190385 RepID=UPI00247A83AC|nr:uncharacterized protein LOC129744596 [Uranotaenia lowii]